MSTTKIKAADLREPYACTEDETAFLDRATDDELHAAALADPDNRPWTREMFEIARRGRRHRLALAETAVELRPVTPSGEGIWAVTDAGGRTVYIQAANIKPAQGGPSGPLYEIVPADGPGHS